MKYKSITNPSYDNSIIFSLACNMCNTELTGKENFCPKCGEKLSPRPPKIAYTLLVDLLNSCLTHDALSLYLHTNNLGFPAPDHGDGQPPSMPIVNIRNTPLKHDTTEDSKTLPANPPSDWMDKDIYTPNTELETKPICPRCQSSPAGCPYLDNGICKAVVFPTFPPQYDPCVFSPTKN